MTNINNLFNAPPPSPLQFEQKYKDTSNNNHIFSKYQFNISFKQFLLFKYIYTIIFLQYNKLPLIMQFETIVINETSSYVKQKANNISNRSDVIVDHSQIQMKQNQMKQIQKIQIIQQQHQTKLKSQQLKKQYYNFFKDIIPDPQNYIPTLPNNQQFKKHKIKYLYGNQFYQNLQSYDQPYIRVKNTQRQSSIVIYTVIISMFELEITLLNINQDANIQKNKIGLGSYGSVRIQSQNKRMFAVKRQMFQNKYHMKQFNMMANKYEIYEVIKQLAIYKICSLLKIGPAAETDIGFDLICYRDCIEFQIQYCIKIEYATRNDLKRGIYVDRSKFLKQIKQCILTLHFYRIIHKDVKPANILFSIKYNKYVLTDFGISHPIIEKIGYRSITYLEGTFQYMSQQMKKNRQNQIRYVDLYGNDVHSLSIVLKKQFYHQNIQKQLKHFNLKSRKQYNTKYEYQYLKLKYYCIKSDSKMEEVQTYWRWMDTNRFCQLIAIVDKSIQYNKIRSVYNYLSNLVEFKDFNLDSLKIQSQSIKSLKINPNIQQNTQLELKNILRVYGYSLQLKEMIVSLKLQQKYKDTLKMIVRILDKDNQVNQRDKLLGNYRSYVKKVKKQLQKFQEQSNMQEMFKRYMILLQFGNTTEQQETIQRLNKMRYQRTEQEKIEQMIRVNYIQRNKKQGCKFEQWIYVQEEKIINILKEKLLYDEVAMIYQKMGKYEKALTYYTKSLNMYNSIHGQQQHPNIVRTYNNIAGVYDSMGNYETVLTYYTKSLNIDIQFHGQQHPHIARTYNNIASVYDCMGKYKNALTYFNMSLNMYISFHGQQHPTVAVTYNNIAGVYKCMGKYETALTYYTKTLNIDISFYREKHPTIARTYNNIADVYNSMGKYETALTYFTKSLNMKLLLYGQQNPNIARTYNNIAGVYDKMGKYETALTYYTKSLNMDISFHGQQHPNIATIYNNIAGVYDSMGKYEAALTYYTKSLNMDITFHGQQHPNIARIYNNIGSVYNSMAKYETALTYFTKSLNMDITFHGQQHPNIATTYNNIASVYKCMGKYEKALTYFTKSLNMDITFHGQQHPHIARTYNNLADVYNNMGKYETALTYYTKSLNMDILFHGQQHPNIATTYNNIASVYKCMGKYEKALTYFTKSLNLDITFHGQQHPTIAGTYNNIAVVYDSMGKYETALTYYTKSLNMDILFHGQQHPNIATTYNNIASVYKCMGKYEKALTYFTKSLNLDITFHGQQHPHIARIYNNIADVYNSMGKYETALTYYTKSLNMDISFHGQQHPIISVIYNNIAGVYNIMGNYDTALTYYTKTLNMDISFHGQQHPIIARTHNNIAGVYDNMGNHETALTYYSKSINLYVMFHGEQHPIVASLYNNIAANYLSLGMLLKSLKYLHKSISISINLFVVTTSPLIANNYHLLSNIFIKKNKYSKSLHYAYFALDTFLSFNPLDHPQSPSYVALLARIYYQMDRFIQSYFFYRLSCQILVRYFPIHHTNVRNAKHMMNEMEWSMPQSTHNYTSNIEFVDNINSKYSQLPKHKLIKVLFAKKWQLKFEQQHRSRRDSVEYLKCVIELYLCYKYLGYLKEQKKIGDSVKEELSRFEQSQQKSMFKEFIQEISIE